MATVADVITYARNLAQTDSNGISDTLGLAFTNDSLENLMRALMERDIDGGLINEVTIPFTPGTGVYPFPNGTLYSSAPTMYALKTMEINMSGTTQVDYLQGQQIDVSNLQFQTSFDWLRVNQPFTQPLYDTSGDTFEIFPTPQQAGSAKIKYWKVPTEYSTTSSTIAYPASLDYRCLSCRVAALYYKSQSDVPMAQIYDGEFQSRLQDIIKILAPGSQQPTKPEKLRMTGWNF